MPTINELQLQWLKGIVANHIAHTRAATGYARSNRILGLTSTILSAVVSTALFSSINQNDSESLVFTAGILSMIATIIAASFSFLKYGELSEQHRQASRKYGVLRRQLELLLTDVSNPDLMEQMKQLNEKRLEVEEATPIIPNKIYESALKSAESNKLINEVKALANG